MNPSLDSNKKSKGKRDATSAWRVIEKMAKVLKFGSVSKSET